MPKHNLDDLTDLHLLILGALWAKGESTIAAIHTAISDESDVSVKTIAILLGRLEKRGLVARRIDGREGVYRATVTRREALMSRLGGVLSAVFAVEEAEAGPSAVRRGEVRPGDEERLLALLRRAARDVRKP